MNLTTLPAFELTRKRWKGYPFKTRVKRGTQIVRDCKELVEKLGRNAPCPCGSKSAVSRSAA
jgi:uncharacterized protein YecA (UPF0149 family)